MDERITASSDTGWPYLERLKAAVHVRSQACCSGDVPELRVAWAEGIDTNAHVAPCAAAIEAASKPKLDPAAAAAAAEAEAAAAAAAASKGGKGGKGAKGGGAGAAVPPAGAPSAASLLGVDPDVLLPSSVRIARDRRAAVALAQARDDLFDCEVAPLTVLGSAAASAGAWPLREWVSPAQHAAWVTSTAWPRERSHSVLMLRAIELRELLDRVVACENDVFSLFLGGDGGSLPSRIDLELVLSRLPNCTRLELRYGVLDRAVAPLAGYAIPLADEGSGGADDVCALLAPPDAVVMGMLPHDMVPLARCLRATDALTTLVLARNCLDDALAVQLAGALASNATVCELDVSHNRIGSPGLEALARLFSHPRGANRCVITSLNASHNAGNVRAGLAFAGALRAAPLLQRLSLSRNALGDEGAAAMLTAVAGHAGCEHLGLAGCGLAGAAAAAAAAALSASGTALITLDVSSNAGAWGSDAALAAVSRAVADARASGCGATRLRVCDVRPAREPAALHEALRANALAAPGGMPLVGAYAASIAAVPVG